MDEKYNLGTSLVETLRSDDVVSIATDAAEMSIDAVISNGLLRDLPVVGTLVSLTKVGFTIRDRLFVRKLVKFLAGLKEVSTDQRRELVEKLEADSEYGRRAGEHLIEILDRIDAHRKPYMTAKVFSAYVFGSIDAKTLHRLNYAIERIPFYEIDMVREVLRMWREEKKIDASEATFHALENAGLMTASPGYGGLVYQPSDLCQKFVDLDLDRTKT